MPVLEDGRGRLVVDIHGNVPRKGAQTAFARQHGVSRVYMARAIRKGKLVVNQYGDVVEAESYQQPQPPPLVSLADICNAAISFIRNTAAVDPAGAESACFTIVDTARRTLNAVTDRSAPKGDQS